MTAKLIIYETAEHVPPGLRFAGRIQIKGELHPVIFHGAERSALHTTMDEWLTAEAARLEKRRAGKPATVSVVAADQNESGTNNERGFAGSATDEDLIG